MEIDPQHHRVKVAIVATVTSNPFIRLQQTMPATKSFGRMAGLAWLEFAGDFQETGYTSFLVGFARKSMYTLICSNQWSMFRSRPPTCPPGGRSEGDFGAPTSTWVDAVQWQSAQLAVSC